MRHERSPALENLRARHKAPLGAVALVVSLAACLDPIPSGTLTSGKGAIEGVVQRRCGTQPALAGVRIALDGVVKAVSDENGRFRIDGITAGKDHILAADLAGYVHVETVVRVTAGETARQNLALETPGDASQPVLLDVLFVLDTTRGAEAAQAALIDAFPAMTSRLPPTSLNLHLGFITADMGAGPMALPGCTPGGDRGLLVAQPLGTTCKRASLLPYTTSRYLAIVRDASGAESANFTGTLEEAFACYAPLGGAGCEFSMPLAALQRALDPGTVDNGDFLRENATLLVVVLSQVDDCSAPPNTDLFDPFQTDLTSPLGPLSRYRCFEFGVLCGGAPPGREPGPRSACEAGVPDPAHALIPVEHLTQVPLRSHAGRVVVGVIAGPTAPVEVVVDSEQFPRLVPSCTAEALQAEPGFRLAAFASGLPQTNRSSLCSDYRQALQSWTQQALDIAVAARSCEQ